MPSSNYAKNETRTDSTDYNFVKIDREIIFTTDSHGKNRRSEIALSLPAIGLYTILKSYCIDKNYAFPCLDTLCKITGCSKNTILKYLKELSFKGLISIQKMPAKSSGGKANNLYVMRQIQKAPRRTAKKEGATIAGHVQPAARTIYQGATIAAAPVQIAEQPEPEKAMFKDCTFKGSISDKSNDQNVNINNINNNKNNYNKDLNDYEKIISQFKDPVNPDSIPFYNLACQSLYNDNCRLIFKAGSLVIQGKPLSDSAQANFKKFLILNNKPETLLTIETIQSGQE